MGWISYLRAGAAQRQARGVFEYAQAIAEALQELGRRHERLEEVVDDHAEAIDELRAELADMRRRIDAFGAES